MLHQRGGGQAKGSSKTRQGRRSKASSSLFLSISLSFPLSTITPLQPPAQPSFQTTHIHSPSRPLCCHCPIASIDNVKVRRGNSLDVRQSALRHPVLRLSYSPSGSNPSTTTTTTAIAPFPFSLNPEESTRPDHLRVSLAPRLPALAHNPRDKKYISLEEHRYHWPSTVSPHTHAHAAHIYTHLTHIADRQPLTAVQARSRASHDIARHIALNQFTPQYGTNRQERPR